MKVVLFCGGLGTRLKEYSDTIPKPMVPLGEDPVVCHIMKYYAHFGHKDFLLCLGYRGDLIKEYFMRHPGWRIDESASGDGRLVVRRVDGDWVVSLVDTGQRSNIGERLVSVRHLLGDDAVFFANYADGLTNLDLNRQLTQFSERDAIASLVLVRPSSQTFHFARVNGSDLVEAITPIHDTNLWINGGFFIFRRDIFNHIRDGEDLVEEPFKRLLARKRLLGYRHTGFWCCMDTFKDKKLLDDMYNRGERPWEVWQQPMKAG